MKLAFHSLAILAFAAASSMTFSLLADEPQAPATTDPPAVETKADPEGWKALFDGKTLGGWKSIDFGGEGEVAVKEGEISLPMGNQLTGILWTKEFPKTNYELRWEARKVDGGDFFSAATFPVGDSHITFVNGGWGGALVGLSSVDGYDASENSTSSVFDFDKGKTYRFRIRVLPNRITVWIDDKSVIDELIDGKKIGVRWEMESCIPLGFASYATHGAIKKIEWRAAKEEQPKAPSDAAPKNEGSR